MRGCLMWLGVLGVLAGISWGEETVSYPPEESVPAVCCQTPSAPAIHRLSAHTTALFSKQANLYEEQQTTAILPADREPTWLELYLALGGIILVALGIVRLAEIRRVDDPCFIATAAWGTPIAREVNLLRGWRDKYLLTSVAGVAFVDLYYRLSPAVAEHVARSPLLAAGVRLMLLPVVLVSDGILLAAVALPVFLITLSGITLVIWFRRRSRHTAPSA